MTRSEKLAWVGVIALMSLAFLLLGASKAQAAPAIFNVTYEENRAVISRIDVLQRCLMNNPRRPARCRSQGIALMTRSQAAVRRVQTTPLPRVRRSCWQSFRYKVVTAFTWSARAGSVYPDRYLVQRYLNYYHTQINNASILGTACAGR